METSELLSYIGHLSAAAESFGAQGMTDAQQSTRNAVISLKKRMPAQTIWTDASTQDDIASGLRAVAVALYFPDEGQPHAAITTRTGKGVKASDAEAMAICCGVRLASDLGIHHAVICNDHEPLIKSLRREEYGHYGAGSGVNLQQLVGRANCHISWQWARRKSTPGSAAADAMARQVLRSLQRGEILRCLDFTFTGTAQPGVIGAGKVAIREY